MPRSRAGPGVEALIASHRFDDAARLAQEVLVSGLVPDERAEVQLLLSSIRLMQGEPGEATVHADAVLAEPGLSEERYASAQLARMLGLLAHGEIAAARTRAEGLLAGPSSAQTDEYLAGAFTTMGCASWNEGRVADALAFFRAAVARASTGDVAGQALHPKQALAVPLVALGRFEEADTLLVQDAADIRTHPDIGWSVGAWSGRARLELARGDAHAAEIAAGQAIRLADESGARLFVPLVRTTLAAIALLDGDLPRATHELHSCESEPPAARGQFASALGSWVMARVVEVAQGPDLAMEVVADVYDNLPAHRRILLEEPAMAPWMVRTAMAAGAATKARDVASAAQLLAQDNPQHECVAAIALHCRGLVRNDVASLADAATGHVHPYARATALEDAARAAAAAGDRRAAIARLQLATTSYREASAHSDAGRARRLGEELSLRRNGERALSRQASGWASLTVIERQVATVIARGLTNVEAGAQLHVSRHTVDFHLRQIFRKLSIHSRVELTRLALEASELHS